MVTYFTRIKANEFPARLQSITGVTDGSLINIQRTRNDCGKSSAYCNPRARPTLSEKEGSVADGSLVNLQRTRNDRCKSQDNQSTEWSAGVHPTFS